MALPVMDGKFYVVAVPLDYEEARAVEAVCTIELQSAQMALART